MKKKVYIGTHLDKRITEILLTKWNDIHLGEDTLLSRSKSLQKIYKFRLQLEIWQVCLCTEAVLWMC